MSAGSNDEQEASLAPHDFLKEEHNTVTDPQDIQWTLKTEDEEYLERLERKLAALKSTENQRTERASSEVQDIDINEFDYGKDSQVEGPIDDDPGLHLLYNQPNASSSMDEHTVSGAPSRQLLSVSYTVSPDTTAVQALTLDPDPSKAFMKSHPARQRTVRFRSRVRIGSGVHTSGDSSPSSSISAPLRHPISENKSTLTFRAGRKQALEQASSLPINCAVPSYGTSDISHDSSAEADVCLDHLRRARRKTEADVIFGRWPWRVLNVQWWLHVVEPIVCCCRCTEEENET